MERIISYDPHTGEFRAKVARGKLSAGAVLGTTDVAGYRVITVGYRKYKAHRLAWFLTHGRWPNGMLDHRNGDKLDNRIANLREADSSQNMMNVRRSRRNSTGFKGVNLFRGKYRAFISARGVSRYLGSFATPEDAHAAYVAASRSLHGEFGRTA